MTCNYFFFISKYPVHSVLENRKNDHKNDNTVSHHYIANLDSFLILWNSVLCNEKRIPGLIITEIENTQELP